jgi:hypothetical protein
MLAQVFEKGFLTAPVTCEEERIRRRTDEVEVID